MAIYQAAIVPLMVIQMPKSWDDNTTLSQSTLAQVGLGLGKVDAEVVIHFCHMRIRTVCEYLAVCQGILLLVLLPTFCVRILMTTALGFEPTLVRRRGFKSFTSES